MGASRRRKNGKPVYYPPKYTGPSVITPELIAEIREVNPGLRDAHEDDVIFMINQVRIAK